MVILPHWSVIFSYFCVPLFPGFRSLFRGHIFCTQNRRPCRRSLCFLRLWHQLSTRSPAGRPMDTQGIVATVYGILNVLVACWRSRSDSLSGSWLNDTSPISGQWTWYLDLISSLLNLMFPWKSSWPSCPLDSISYFSVSVPAFKLSVSPAPEAVNPTSRGSRLAGPSKVEFRSWWWPANLRVVMGIALSLTPCRHWAL